MTSQGAGKGGSGNVMLVGTFPPAFASKLLAPQLEQDAEVKQQLTEGVQSDKIVAHGGHGQHIRPRPMFGHGRKMKKPSPHKRRQQQQCPPHMRKLLSHQPPPLTHPQLSLRMLPPQLSLWKQ